MSKRNKKKHRSHGRPPVVRAEAAPVTLAAEADDAVAGETTAEPGDAPAESEASPAADDPLASEATADGPGQEAMAEATVDASPETAGEPSALEEPAQQESVAGPTLEAAEPQTATEPAGEQAVVDLTPADPAEAPAPADGVAEAPAEGEDASVLPPAQIRAAVEALMFASPHPITPREIARVLEGVRKEDWQRELDTLRADYSRDERGLQVIEVAGGYQITTRPEYNDWVRELLDPRTPTRLSIQALETLAVIAYKQPVTLPEIIELRGVKSGGVVKTLLEKRLIRITGRKEVVGRPILYGTTKQFLLHFGLKDLNELPKIEEFAEVLGEEVDVAGLKRAIESPLPVQVGLSDPDGEQIPLFEGATPPPGHAGEPAAPDGEGAGGEATVGADDATGELFTAEPGGGGEASPADEPPEPPGDPS